MKLLEKDIHEKQDTVISLRRQLEDIKLINLDMYKKLQVRSTEFFWMLFLCHMYLCFSYRMFTFVLVGAVYSS